ncbi:MAG: hypothetical protein AB7E71_16320 [Dongiaceae bacterium]
MLGSGGAGRTIDDREDVAQGKETRVVVERNLRESAPPQQILEAHVHAVQELRHTLDGDGADERDVRQDRGRFAAGGARAPGTAGGVAVAGRIALDGLLERETDRGYEARRHAFLRFGAI